eukprot:CAMPEP_0184687148 /NCGR_PEP_ID=MMETSP0312-20130426/25292_1 /TAXON_ID=31354 /ORGANISM="Compsopogon coeruleus, Strain SAG 36.94" /LENGTH=282 /DNA_ID=CAMNT_0027142947 /DNA_START=229 /DNA_END=1078 /DNA_ORIENTATION=+
MELHCVMDGGDRCVAGEEWSRVETFSSPCEAILDDLLSPLGGSLIGSFGAKSGLEGVNKDRERERERERWTLDPFGRCDGSDSLDNDLFLASVGHTASGEPEVGMGPSVDVPSDQMPKEGLSEGDKDALIASPPPFQGPSRLPESLSKSLERPRTVRRYTLRGPSKYCHVCQRTDRVTNLLRCSNLEKGAVEKSSVRFASAGMGGTWSEQNAQVPGGNVHTAPVPVQIRHNVLDMPEENIRVSPRRKTYRLHPASCLVESLSCGQAISLARIITTGIGHKLH